MYKIVNDIIRQNHMGFLDKVEKKVSREVGDRLGVRYRTWHRYTFMLYFDTLVQPILYP
jgi:hypothetical protein